MTEQNAVQTAIQKDAEEKLIEEKGYTVCKAELADKLGMHARPSALITKSCMNYQRKVYLIKTEKPDEKYNGKEVMSLMTMGAEYKTPIKAYVEGTDEKAKEVCRNILLILSSNLEEIADKYRKDIEN